MLNFEKFVGHKTFLMHSADPDAPTTVGILRGCEAAGLWIEDQSVTDMMLEKMGTSIAECTLVVFVPFLRIYQAVVAADAPSISSKIVE